MSIIELINKEKNGLPMSDKEKAYLKKYRELKKVRHSTEFIAHVKELPEE